MTSGHRRDHQRTVRRARTPPAIAAAKLVDYLVWAVLVATVLVVLPGVIGLVLGLGPLDVGVLTALARQHILTVLTATLAVPRHGRPPSAEDSSPASPRRSDSS